MACLTPNNIVQVDIQLIFEMVNTFCINSCLWKSIPIVNHSLCEEIFFYNQGEHIFSPVSLYDIRCCGTKIW